MTEHMYFDEQKLNDIVINNELRKIINEERLSKLVISERRQKEFEDLEKKGLGLTLERKIQLLEYERLLEFQWGSVGTKDSWANIAAHLSLDVLGIVLDLAWGVGAVADVANAIWYASEGSFFFATLSGISAIPGAGDLVGKPIAWVMRLPLKALKYTMFGPLILALKVSKVPIRAGLVKLAGTKAFKGYGPKIISCFDDLIAINSIKSFNAFMAKFGGKGVKAPPAVAAAGKAEIKTAEQALAKGATGAGAKGAKIGTTATGAVSKRAGSLYLDDAGNLVAQLGKYGHRGGARQNFAVVINAETRATAIAGERVIRQGLTKAELAFEEAGAKLIAAKSAGKGVAAAETALARATTELGRHQDLLWLNLRDSGKLLKAFTAQTPKAAEVLATTQLKAAGVSEKIGVRATEEVIEVLGKTEMAAVKAAAKNKTLMGKIVSASARGIRIVVNSLMLYDKTTGQPIVPQPSPDEGGGGGGGVTVSRYRDCPNLPLKKKCKGEKVKEAQTCLKKLGYSLGRWGVDGKFGSATKTAVKKFQKAEGLSADGVIGEDTWPKLEETCRGASEPEPSPDEPTPGYVRRGAFTVRDVPTRGLSLEDIVYLVEDMWNAYIYGGVEDEDDKYIQGYAAYQYQKQEKGFDITKHGVLRSTRKLLKIEPYDEARERFEDYVKYAPEELQESKSVFDVLCEHKQSTHNKTLEKLIKSINK
jgi:hypothetical protein